MATAATASGPEENDWKRVTIYKFGKLSPMRPTSETSVRQTHMKLALMCKFKCTAMENSQGLGHQLHPVGKPLSTVWHKCAWRRANGPMENYCQTLTTSQEFRRAPGDNHDKDSVANHVHFTTRGQTMHTTWQGQGYTAQVTA
jgi:hypothetical protein